MGIQKMSIAEAMVPEDFAKCVIVGEPGGFRLRHQAAGKDVFRIIVTSTLRNDDKETKEAE